MASAPTIPTTLVLPNLGPTYGALFLGGMGAAILFGATNIQVYFYFTNYKQDRIFQKFVVAFLWLLDSLHMAFVIAELWHYLIDLFGNYLILGVVTWAHKAQIAMMIVIVLLVQSLYTLRVWKLNGDQNRLWSWVLIANLLSGYAAGIILLVLTMKIALFTQLARIRWSIYLSFSMTTFNDIMLTIAMCHMLYHGTTVFAETKSILGIIIRYVVVSGALTSLCSIIGVITVVTMPNNFVFLGVALVLSKLYINSYLALMNARKSIRNTAGNTLQLSDIEGRIQARDFYSNASAETVSYVDGRDKMGEGVRVRIDVIRQREEAMLRSGDLLEK
ncbi:hypothetical protein F5887DRAFT_1285695 [Amanita rubescens]|nr:hypothetical protein F5887DRAFT_1285695 [Amanita rubescens]